MGSTSQFSSDSYKARMKSPAGCKSHRVLKGTEIQLKTARGDESHTTGSTDVSVDGICEQCETIMSECENVKMGQNAKLSFF